MPPTPPLRHTLRNGLRLVVLHDRSLPAVAVCVWYDAGSRHDPSGGSGLAHLLEHLMFRGSSGVAAGEHTALIESAGGETNASTGFERVLFYSTVPSRELGLVLRLEADRMFGLPDGFTEGELEIQRAVVLNERRERYEDVPYGTVWETVVAATFPAGHPCHHLPIGTAAGIARATLADCVSFHRRRYASSNAVLSVVGDVDPDAVVRQVESLFGSGPPARDPVGYSATAAPVPVPASTQRIRRTQGVPVPALSLACQLPSARTPAGPAADLAVLLLGGLTSSRLHTGLVRRRQLASSARFTLLALHDFPSVGILNVRLSADASPADAETALDGEIGSFADAGPTSAELRRGLAQIRRRHGDATATLAGRARELCRYETLFGDADMLSAALTRSLDVSAEDVRAVAALYLTPAHRVTFLIEPEPAR
ncbi:pitrilysin family protein [Dactylosporangium sp. NPDC005555]|uniref:M16 family metallopeptidase n=1 Tax=Dactylosporangium sp. NPDC005555 TaxID=3154889 RepID=UPI0033BAA87C